MVLVLVIGDFHIPQRAVDLPRQFKKLLVPGKIQRVLCTGNLTDKPTFDWLRSLSQDVYIVRGDYDTFSSSHGHTQGPLLPPTNIITEGQFRIGLLHGHQLVPWDDTETLALTARHFDADILCAGHTAQVECFEYAGKMYINPGSATGAWRPGLPQPVVPSFVLMDVQEWVVVTYVYRLIDGEVKIEKMKFTKQECEAGK